MARGGHVRRGISTGAYGAKISGARMGGSIIALVKDEETGRKVVDACKAVGAENGWTSKIGEDAKVQGQDAKGFKEKMII